MSESLEDFCVDQTFNDFCKQWANKDPKFRLDQPEVRENMVMLISCAMSLLAVAPPEVAANFMRGCMNVAKSVVPPEIQARISGGG